MTEHPILFSGPMVRAILDGTKTMTRRVIRPQPTGEFKTISPMAYDCQWGIPVLQGGKVAHACPYGFPGDRLWVRETCGFFDPALKTVTYKADGYEAKYPQKWKSARYMPRWASRITLEVVSVRVERVQDISEEDARKEGMIANRFENASGQTYPNGSESPYRRAFAIIWNSINGKRGFGWDVNPWVWMIEFKRVTP